MAREGLILKIDCPDREGLVARIAGYVCDHRGNLLELNQFTDRENSKFFARFEIDTAALDVEVDDFVTGFGTLGRSFNANWHFRRLPYRMRTAVLVTRTDHCLNEILWRTRLGELPVEITSVIGNREDCRDVVEREGLVFHHVDMSDSPSPRLRGGGGKEAGFEKIAAILEKEEVELAVLARFMQIVPDWLCDAYAGRMINIHHSFLPAFVGANPYRKAYERGVKLIGATCHYVSRELDAGPIIEQEVQRVEHFHSVNDLIRIGRDCERSAIARGIRYHVHDRTIVDGHRAIVFPD